MVTRLPKAPPCRHQLFSYQLGHKSPKDLPASAASNWSRPLPRGQVFVGSIGFGVRVHGFPISRGSQLSMTVTNCSHSGFCTLSGCIFKAHMNYWEQALQVVVQGARLQGSGVRGALGCRADRSPCIPLPNDLKLDMAVCKNQRP